MFVFAHADCSSVQIVPPILIAFLTCDSRRPQVAALNSELEAAKQVNRAVYLLRHHLSTSYLGMHAHTNIRTLRGTTTLPFATLSHLVLSPSLPLSPSTRPCIQGREDSVGTSRPVDDASTREELEGERRDVNDFVSDADSVGSASFC